MDNSQKVEQFLLLAKNARGLALVDLIGKCTAEPGLYTFGEILSLPGVQELQHSEHAAAYELLQLYAYGTWKDYRADPSRYPPLSEAQQHKLKLLSLVSATDGARTLSYDALTAAAELPNVRALEDALITDCFYSGLLRGTLDQRNRCLHVEAAFCRDVRPADLPGVAASLGEWLGAANGVLRGIEERIDWTVNASAAAERQRAEAAAALEAERKSIRTTIELQAQADSSGMLMDEQEGFSLAELEGAQDARPGPSSGRHTKRRRQPCNSPEAAMARLSVNTPLALCLLALCLQAAAGYRHLLDTSGPTDEEGFFTNGRATWFEHPHTGSCGYGKLDGYKFGRDAVAAMPDVNPDYKAGACGRCYELKCRGIRALSADGSVDLDRSDACYDTSTRIIIQIVDTCPCKGNEKWCCGDAGLVHFDLSDGAFSRLAPQGKGIIGLAWRPVPCELAGNGTASQQDWQEMEQAVEAGASLEVFTDGQPGQGWKKTVNGDDLQAMYTYNSSLVAVGGGDRALCTTVGQYGGFDFHTHAPSTIVFENAEAVEYWVRGPQGGTAGDLVIRLGNVLGRACTKEVSVLSGLTQEVTDGWTRVYHPISAFECKDMGDYGTTPSQVNRLQWENKNPSKQGICVKDVKIVPRVASFDGAGRR